MTNRLQINKLITVWVYLVPCGSIDERGEQITANRGVFIGKNDWKRTSKTHAQS